MRNVPAFKIPMEVRLGLQLSGRVLKFEAAKRWSEKLSVAKDIKTYISAFELVLKEEGASQEFLDYVAEVKREVMTTLNKADSVAAVSRALVQPSTVNVEAVA